jgi:hypothetical protein
VTAYGLGDRVSIPRRGFFLYPLRPDRLWGPPSLPQWVPGTFRGGKCDRGVLLTIHPLPVPRLRKRGAVPPLPQCALWARYGTPSRLPRHRLIVSHCCNAVSVVFPTCNFSYRSDARPPCVTHLSVCVNTVRSWLRWFSVHVWWTLRRHSNVVRCPKRSDFLLSPLLACLWSTGISCRRVRGRECVKWVWTAQPWSSRMNYGPWGASFFRWRQYSRKKSRSNNLLLCLRRCQVRKLG